MDKEKFAQAIQEIGTCEDEAQRRALLAKLNTDTESVFNENANLKTEKEKLEADKQKVEADNESLLKANMDLFLQVGSKKSDDEVIKNKTGIESDPEPKRKFEDLFDEKGGLK